jgi:anaerobic magnesium-protoporphyrin IX monomethyl ester cyclase
MLIVNPNNRIKGIFSAIEPPLWAGLIAGYHNAEILDAEAMDLTLDQTEDAIRIMNPRKVIIVVMGNNPSVSSTPKMPVSEALAKRIKDLDVSLTGIHPIAVGSKFKVIDKPFEGTPSVPWGKLPMNKYRAHNWQCLDGTPRSPYASVYTSLGCPYHCYYCNINVLYGGHKVTLRSIGDILEEINLLAAKYQVHNIKFWDELFAWKEQRVIDICKELVPYKLNIWAYARLDSVTKKILKAMKDGGINWVAYGIESVIDDKFVSGTERVIRMTRDAGINIIGNFMFGLPGEPPETMQQSLDFAKKHLFEYVNFYVARPYPGSQWYKDTKPNMNWEEYDQYGKNRTSFRDYAFMEYFSNPAYLDMIRHKFGNQATLQIGDMLAQR